MSTTAEMTIGAFSDALAAQTSTPGGGGAAAIAGSYAAALVSMVINFTVGKKKYADVDAELRAILEQTETLRLELLRLADDDVDAFTGVAATYGMPKESDDEKAARTAAMQEALKVAAKVPFITAEKCLMVVELAEPVGAKGNPNVVSDAATAVNLASAALKSAILNVDVNLKMIKDEEFVADFAERRDALLERAARADAAARAACAATLGVNL